MFQFLLQLVGVATLAPGIHRDGVTATGQRHPLLPLVVAWAVEQSLLLAVGSGTPLDALRRERREAVVVLSSVPLSVAVPAAGSANTCPAVPVAAEWV